MKLYLIWSALSLVTGLAPAAYCQGTINGTGFSCLIYAWDHTNRLATTVRCGSLAEAQATGLSTVQVTFKNRVGTFMNWGDVDGDWPAWHDFIDNGGPAGMGWQIDMLGQVQYRHGEYRASWVRVTAWPGGVPYTLPKPEVTWASPGYFGICPTVDITDPCMHAANHTVAEFGWSMSEPLSALAAGATVTIPLGAASDSADNFTDEERSAMGWTWLPMEMQIPTGNRTWMHFNATLRLRLVDAEPYTHPESGWHDIVITQHAEPSLTIPAMGHVHLRGDFDRDGACGVDDIFAFLTCWFAGEPRADWDGDGTCGVADIFAFLTEWFQ